jgi:replicative DNA helicase
LAGLDEHTLGLRGVTVLAAAPNVGKTAFTAQLGLGVARHWEENRAVFVLVSLEMSRDAIYARLLCHEARIDWETLMLGSEGLRGRPEGTPVHA